MDLENEILKEHSKRQTVRIALWIGDDPKRFKELMELFLHGDYVVTQRAAWIVSECFDRSPQLIPPWLPALLKKMQEPGVHDAVKRNTVRILQFVDIPKRLLGTAVSACFDFLNSPDTPIAVKANAMTVLLHAAEREPGLRRELEASIELQVPSMIPALCARSRIVMKRLKKTSDERLATPSR